MPEIQDAALYRQAVASLDRGDYAGAIAGLGALVARDPLHHEAFQHLAIAQLCVGNGEAALDAATRALILLPDCLEYLLVRAEAYRLAKDYDRARRDLAHAIALDPGCFAAYNNAAIVEKAVGNYALAEQRLEKALALKPDYLDAIYNLARLKAQTGALDQAAAQLAKARALRPDDPRFAVAPGALVEPIAASPPARPVARTAADDDRALLGVLAASLQAGQIRLVLDVKKLDHPDSPVSRQTDSNQVLAVAVAFVLALLFLAPLPVAGAATLVVVLAYMRLMPKYLETKLRNRIASDALASPDAWEKLWRYGGLGLEASDGSAKALSPAENWRSLVAKQDPP